MGVTRMDMYSDPSAAPQSRGAGGVGQAVDPGLVRRWVGLQGAANRLRWNVLSAGRASVGELQAP
jgi:hypothetical protein